LKRYLDLACLGTIADVVPLNGTNRLLVKFGLQEAGTTTRPGIKALREVAAVSTPLSVTHVAFRLAPRLNAAGRLADPKIALDLLLSEREEEAYVLANRLEELNRERQVVEEKVTREAFLQIEKEQADRKGIVAVGIGWHLGVVGIVAAKLTERFGRPSVALTLSDDGREAKGSARTVAGFSVYAPLKKIEHLMLRFGGHAAAAGMTIAADQLTDFKDAFNAAVCDLWNEEPSPTTGIDATLNLREIGAALVRDLERMEPFGPGNLEPMFGVSDVSLEGCRVVGRSGAQGKGHLKTTVCQDGVRLDGIAFNHGNYLPTALATQRHRVIFTPQRNEWNGKSSLQMKIKELQPTN
jgi:single-stranded-DNA-specific exonuclease